MEKNPMERPPENISEKEKKEKEACSRICELVEELFKNAEEETAKEGDFSPPSKVATKRYAIKNAPDYMVAVAQRERIKGEELLESVREEDNYYEEKVASKLKVFLRKEESLLRSLAEIQSHFPELASLLMAQKPYLKEKGQEAEKDWKNNR
ncbi:MAG: hypothetical protein ACQEP6_00775 [Patescibacteria group bacterium]